VDDGLRPEYDLTQLEGGVRGKYYRQAVAGTSLTFPGAESAVPPEPLRSGTLGEGAQIMATSPLDWSQCPAVESIPGKVSGAWTFRNSRTPVQLVFENLEDGMTIDEIIEQWPVSRDEIKAVLDFAARSLDKAPSF
jgi:uncharacterized protein (DUF433 family)